MLESEPGEEPDVPVVLSVVPLPLVDELPDVSPVVVALELLPGVVIVSDAPLLPLLIPEELEPEELSVAGSSVVVVVVVTELLSDEAPEEPDDGASVAVGSFVVVVVVVVCPNDAVAVPNSDRKMAIGNFFMLAP